MSFDFPTSTPPFLSANLMAGRYELGQIIGEGGMGIVYRARDRALDREVAVKLVKPGVPASAPVVARFVGEATVTGQLQHPGIPPVHELGTLADGQPFLAMKLVKGRTLRELLRERPGPAAELGRYVAVFEQVCHAVGYAHAHRVIHRDLKPANIMVGAHGEVQVMDWGLAKVLGEQAGSVSASEDSDPHATVEQQTEIGAPEPGVSTTRTGSVLGTPGYMPPEQAGGEVRKLDARSDVFGLGAILCEVLTGKCPYEGKDSHAVLLKAVRGEVAEALARLESCGAEPDMVALCKRCLELRQEDRPEDGRAVAMAVAEIRQASEARARQAELDRERALVRTGEQAKRRRLLLYAGGAIVMVLLAGLGASLWQMDRANRERDRAQTAEAKAQDSDQMVRLVFREVWNAKRLGKEPMDPDTISVLVRAAEHPDREVRGEALSLLSERASKDPRTLPAVLKALQDKDPLVRNTAYYAHSRVTGKLDLLLPYLLRLRENNDAEWPVEGKDEETRKARQVERNLCVLGMAIQLKSLCEVRAEETAAILVRLLDDPSAKMRVIAAGTIGLWAPLEPSTLLPELVKHKAAEKVRKLSMQVSTPFDGERVRRALDSLEAATRRLSAEAAGLSTAGASGLVTTPWLVAFHCYRLMAVDRSPGSGGSMPPWDQFRDQYKSLDAPRSLPSVFQRSVEPGADN
jgi:serine/threonine protein kinase